MTCTLKRKEHLESKVYTTTHTLRPQLYTLQCTQLRKLKPCMMQIYPLALHSLELSASFPGGQIPQLPRCFALRSAQNQRVPRSTFEQADWRTVCHSVVLIRKKDMRAVGPLHFVELSTSFTGSRHLCLAVSPSLPASRVLHFYIIKHLVR